MSTHRHLIALALLILFLFNGCQSSTPLSTDVTSVTSEITSSVSPAEAVTPTVGQNMVFVPHGRPPVIDGKISPGEWEQALIEVFADGSELLLVYNASYLYIGIRARAAEMIVGNIFIERNGEIAVLHASAALGTAIYQKGGDSWQQTQNFDWRCRDTSQSQSAQAERAAFLQDEGWVATNSRIGAPHELEFQIEMLDDTLIMAVNFIRASKPDEKIPWPVDLNDDCIKPTSGGLPVQMVFSPDKWSRIELSSQD